jgi:hypothetical protein
VWDPTPQPINKAPRILANTKAGNPERRKVYVPSEILPKASDLLQESFSAKMLQEEE